jgi:hypothetical protein
VPSVTKSSLITTISCQTIRIPRGWEEPGETTIRTISGQHIGGAMEKRDPLESASDGPLAGHFTISP